MPSAQRKRYALVGTGGRAVMFTEAITDPRRHAATSQLVGMCDVSPTRMAWHNEQIAKSANHPPLPTYPAGDFERMIDETKPNTVIVCTPDALHHEYIIRAMKKGCDVISEKPMTTDADKAKVIFRTIEETGRKLRVTFNYRYTNHTSKVKELIQGGAIGKPLAVDFTWVLNTSHGADYFRRWHRQKANSGGLLVHKATHHFDLVTWWIDSYPKRVFAMGDLKFYGKKNAVARGEHDRLVYERYTGKADPKTDPFALDLTSDDGLRGLYLNAEKDSGYVRDRNVFNDDITIEDTMAVLCEYRNGVIMNYSLIAYSPWEGLRVAVTGTKGRVELYDQHGSHIIAGQGDDELAARQQAQGLEQSLTLFPMFGVPRQVEV
ncbi:MAG: Gfo/Idh/MocA family protein, partial [Tepidisphaeraceae bacterium]